MKRTLGITLAVALAMSAVAAPAMGASEKAKGKGLGLAVQVACEAPFGQLVSAVRAGKIEHPPIVVRGIPALLEAGIPPGHCGVPVPE